MRVESNIDPPLIDLGSPEFHADGIARVELRGTTVKFVAFSWRVSQMGEAERREVLTLALPVSAFPGGEEALRERWGAILYDDRPRPQPN